MQVYRYFVALLRNHGLLLPIEAFEREVASGPDLAGMALVRRPEPEQAADERRRDVTQEDNAEVGVHRPYVQSRLATPLRRGVHVGRHGEVRAHHKNRRGPPLRISDRTAEGEIRTFGLRLSDGGRDVDAGTSPAEYPFTRGRGGRRGD